MTDARDRASTWLTAAFGILAAIGFPDASAELVRTGYSQIAIAHDGKCLDIEGSSLADGAPLIQYDCRSKTSQQWTIQRFKNAFRVVSLSSRLCLTIDGASTAAGAPAVQSACTAASTGQLWTVSNTSAPYRLTALHSGLCLAVDGGVRTNGASLSQEPCGVADGSRQFDVIGGLVSPNNKVYVINRASGNVAAVQNGQSALGTSIVHRSASGAPSEKWTLEPRGASTYQLVDFNSGKCLVLDGSAVVLGNCNANPNELWTPRPIGKSYRFVSRQNGKCLDAPGGNGSDLDVATCSTATRQQWSLATSTVRGSWSDIIPFSLVPVAAANLPNGKILTWAAFDPMVFFPSPIQNAHTYAQIFDPSKPASASNPAPLIDVTNTNHDMFCPGTSNLSDGRVFVNGGNNDNNLTSIYDSVTDTWTAGAAMNIGRGYPGSTPLSNGNVFTLGGSWNGDPAISKNGEVWNATSGWTDVDVPIDPFFYPDTSGASSGDNHMWLFAADNGDVFQAGPSPHMHWITTDLAGGATLSAGDRGDDTYAINGNARMFDIGRILKLGGAIGYKQNDPASAKAYVIDIRKKAAVTVTKVGPLNKARTFPTSVVLPTGQVVVVGGLGLGAIFWDSGALMEAELWDPDTQVFTLLPAMDVPRTYHSVALLLEDGRVFSAGGGLCGPCAEPGHPAGSTNHPDAQIFTPPYLFDANGNPAVRPVITSPAPDTARLGSKLTVTTDSPVTSFALIRLSSNTHAVDNDQRRIPLSYVSLAAANTYRLFIPTSPGTAVPGYYYLFAINAQGVPSVAQTFRVF